MDEVTTSLRGELSRLFGKLSSLNKSASAVRASISLLNIEISEREGAEKQTLTNEQLYYLISVVLETGVPASKAFALCAEEFNKSEVWAKKVIRYSPIKEQAEGVLSQLERGSNFYFQSLLKYKLLNKRKLIGSSDYRAFLKLLKEWSKIAQSLAGKDAEIERLNSLVEGLETEIIKKDKSLQMVKGLKPKEHAIFLRNEYKEMPLKQIAKIVGVSRQTVSKYIMERS